MIHHLSAILILVLCTILAQSVHAAAPAPPEDKPPDLTLLPKPLDMIQGNILDLETDGLFQVMAVRLGTAGASSDEAVIWTLRAKRSISMRHAEVFLSRFRDVRFFRTGRNEGRPVFSTLLFYARQIGEDAINGESLAKNSPLEVWIYLDRNERLKLVGAHADTVNLRPLKKRRL